MSEQIKLVTSGVPESSAGPMKKFERERRGVDAGHEWGPRGGLWGVRAGGREEHS
ncbi:MAG: hypothetical protein INH41_31075 [Myxococcaceae bacterium]|nr:hypothetical protein [Myxococcaceae bacterium]